MSTLKKNANQCLLMKQWSLMCYLSATIWRDGYFHVLWLHSERSTASSNNVSLPFSLPVSLLPLQSQSQSWAR